MIRCPSAANQRASAPTVPASAATARSSPTEQTSDRVGSDAAFAGADELDRRFGYTSTYRLVRWAASLDVGLGPPTASSDPSSRPFGRSISHGVADVFP